jgi:hypothetical protein
MSVKSAKKSFTIMLLRKVNFVRISVSINIENGLRAKEANVGLGRMLATQGYISGLLQSLVTQRSAKNVVQKRK